MTTTVSDLNKKLEASKAANAALLNKLNEFHDKLLPLVLLFDLVEKQKNENLP